MMATLLLGPLACHQPERPQESTSAAITEGELDSLWAAALSVLRKHDFQPDRQDKTQGVITTLPSTSMQWGEFWRRDVADTYSYGESSLHTMQRQATIRFVKSNGWTVEVQVDVYRLNMPESQITTASACYQAFSGVLPDTEGTLQIKGTPRRSWVHLGRDGAMERRLLSRILATSTGS